MIMLFPVLYFGWKFIKKTKFKRAHEIDLQQDLAEIEHYTRNFVEVQETNKFNRFLDKVFG
jgi:amino acid transporter